MKTARTGLLLAAGVVALGFGQLACCTAVAAPTPCEAAAYAPFEASASTPQRITTLYGVSERYTQEDAEATDGWTLYCVPGFPGTAIDFAKLARELLGSRDHEIQRIVVLNLPGHGAEPPSDDWHYGMEQYAEWLSAELHQLAGTYPQPHKRCVIAHSVGAEMLVRALMTSPDDSLAERIVLVNPWMPSLYNEKQADGRFSIRWSADDDDLADGKACTTWLTTHFGYTRECATYEALFACANSSAARAHRYMFARRSSRAAWLGHAYTKPTVALLKGTAKTQRDLLREGEAYTASSQDGLAQVASKHGAIPVLLLESEPGVDQVILSAYKQGLDPRLEALFGNVHRVAVPGAGHMLQVEQAERAASEILSFLP